MKSIAQILQQAMDIIARLSHRAHTTCESMSCVAHIHNTYIGRAAAAMGHIDCSTLTVQQMLTALSPTQYRPQTQANGTL